MRSYVTYVADDGTEFHDEGECLSYEQAQKCSHGLRFFDESMHQITDSYAIEAAQEAFFFVVDNDAEAEEFLAYLRENDCNDWPSGVSDGQAWAFEPDEGVWMEIHSLIDSYHGILHTLGCVG